MRVTGRALVRMGSMLAVLPMVLLVTAPAGAASEHGTQLAEVRAETTPFGMLGPVGLVAVALGLAGMVAGTVRHLKRVRVDTDSQPEVELPDIGQQAQHTALDPAETHN